MKLGPFHAPAGATAPRRLRLLAAASAAALLTAGPAAADCMPGAAGPRDFVCTSTFSTADLSMARTVALTNATVAGRLVFAPTVGGNIGFSMDAKSSVTAPNADTAPSGVTLQTTNGSIDTSTPSGSGINGAITAPAGTALLASTSGAGANINITTSAGGALIGGRYGAGLSASTTSDGAINLNLGAKASGFVGVAASSVDGAININLGADVSGAAAGVIANASGKGAISITAAGALTASGPAVSATSGSGNISLKLNGDVSSSSMGVSAQSSGGDVTITSAGKITAGAGIVASTIGVGAMTATTNGPVTASQGDGVDTSSVDGVNTVYVGAGGIAAAQNGVVATASGKGAVKIQTLGDVSGKSGYGVAASTVSGSIEIDLDKGTFVAGGLAGVAVQTQSGTATLNNAATISAVGAGAGVLIDANNGSVTVNNSGIISAAGRAIDVASGAALIANSGEIDGQIVGAGLTTVKNSGVWNNAAGSTISYLTNAGVLSMGASDGTVGFLTVKGSATFGPNSFYNARITAMGSDTILVAGKTTIAGGTVTISAADGALQRGAKYILLYSAGGVVGQFTSVTAGDSSYSGVLGADANDIYMTALLRDFRSYARTKNQKAVATAIYYGAGSLSAGAGGQLLAALNQTSDAAIPGALGQLSGDGVVTGAANMDLQAGHLFSAVMDDQQTLWRDSAARDAILRPIRPFEYAPVRVEGQQWPVSRQTSQPAPASDNEASRRWRVWASGFGGRQTLQGDQNAGSATQSSNSYGGALGVDYQLGSKMLIGAALGSSANSFSAGAPTGNSVGVHVGGYTGFRVGSFYGTAGVAYGNYSNHVKRTIGPIGASAGEQETADFTSEEVRTRLEIGRRSQTGQFAITPFTAIEIAHIHTKPFVESSQGSLGSSGIFGLSYASQGIRSTPTFIGLKAEARLDLADAILTPWVSIAWRHEWSDSRTQTAALVALPTASFVAVGAQPARDALQVKGGVSLSLTQTVALFATFEGEFGTKNPVYAGKGGLKVGW